ncbi:hypothetical protein EDD16DRAFT_1515336 [Pisolithus croceorrhizus]|nr:hypothetical protein EDD16DRAFT_1515336 [Pisolithus croceorrhizus]
MQRYREIIVGRIMLRGTVEDRQLQSVEQLTRVTVSIPVPPLRGQTTAVSISSKLSIGEFGESGLLQELLNIRKAVEAQKAVIEELVRARAIPCIDRLPDELLAQIFLLNRFERESLASVSRRWRAVIMDTPSFWSEIRLELYEECPRLLKLHLERSRQAPLTVSLYYDQPELDVVLLHVNRIRVLRILGSAPDILDRFASLTFAALEDLLVDLDSESVDPLLSMYSRAPALKCLRLEQLDESFSTTSLTTRYLDNNSLTRLSLTGIASWRIPRDSIRLPALESLALRINDPISFLEAIVVPKLKRFEFSEGHCGSSTYVAFCGLTSKFDNVDHLVFAPPLLESLYEDALDLAMEICRVFRGVVRNTPQTWQDYCASVEFYRICVLESFWMFEHGRDCFIFIRAHLSSKQLNQPSCIGVDVSRRNGEHTPWLGQALEL